MHVLCITMHSLIIRRWTISNTFKWCLGIHIPADQLTAAACIYLADRPSQKIVPQCTSCSQLAIIAIVRFLKLLTAAKIVPYNLRKRRQKPFHSPINLQKKCRKLCNCFFYPTILWFVVFTKSFLTWLPNGNLVLFCGLVTISNPFAILPRISARKHFVAFRRYS